MIKNTCVNTYSWIYVDASAKKKWQDDASADWQVYYIFDMDLIHAILYLKLRCKYSVYVLEFY